MNNLLRRLAQGVGVLFATFTLTFLLLQVMPGDSLMIRFENPELGLSQEEVDHLRTVYGADRPIVVQFLATVGAFLQGDFGFSIVSGTPVSQLITAALPGTALLAGLAFVVALAIAGIITIIASWPGQGWIANLFSSIPSLFVAVPVFWLGVVLVQVFSFQLGWIPVINPGPIAGLVLPVLTIAIPISAPIAGVFIKSMDDVRTSPFITVVRAKGASNGWILWRNIFKNAALPTMTVAGVLFGELIGGAVVTETIFGRHGLGKIAEQAVASQDVAVLQAVVLVTAAAFVVITLIVDLIYPLLDPRVRAA